ncbi:major capsid protein [Peromfec virus RodF8_9]|uniref:Major capsid protein n=1 Tax=Peromfec virus RodF8_9 TaxID=2929390 RepID=A0A976R5I8_9VIRU|nr:major capsid protein [Peromfec virus RodF8_9]
MSNLKSTWERLDYGSLWNDCLLYYPGGFTLGASPRYQLSVGQTPEGMYDIGLNSTLNAVHGASTYQLDDELPFTTQFYAFCAYNTTRVPHSLLGTNVRAAGLCPLLSSVNQSTGVIPVIVVHGDLAGGPNVGDEFYYVCPCGSVSYLQSGVNPTFQIPSDPFKYMRINNDSTVVDKYFDMSKCSFYLGYAFVRLADKAESVLNWKASLPATIDVVSAGSQSVPLSALDADQNPFINGKIPLNALPFRAYEQIYNAFFRDERNNPMLINNKPYYDKYLQSTDGGADANTYSIHQRNWEQDFLTTALPSPQQGDAPLVGISATGVMTLSDEDGNVYQAMAQTADDNDTIIGASFIQTNQDGSAIPQNVARSLVSYATSGISINDFRNVNALQRYLETNLRRGLKYRDLVAARWGVNISYSEMNMPEFIGGMTEYINSVQVNQQSETTDSEPLGSYAGQLYCQGKQKHKIRHFCDEAGFIIGVISVVPVPVYSQLLPKIFTKFDQLDFFNPEFGHIGMQPIPMKEVAPLQVALNNGNLDETFGYQRAWYDYLGRVDEVHGQFRSSLRDFVMYRTFDGIPRLSTDFLLVDNTPLDNVFSVQRDADGNSVDKILGQIYVDCVTRRPIPRYGIPKLE